MALIGITWPLGLCQVTVPIAENIVEAPCLSYDSGGEHGDEIGGINRGGNCRVRLMLI